MGRKARAAMSQALQESSLTGGLSPIAVNPSGDPRFVTVLTAWLEA